MGCVGPEHSPRDTERGASSLPRRPREPVLADGDCRRRLERLLGAEVLPSGVSRDIEHIRSHIRQQADTAFHPVGTCRLGTDASAVVDPWLRVVGVFGLRVVDASVMPTTVAGNAQAAVFAIAERAVDFIRSLGFHDHHLLYPAR